MRACLLALLLLPGLASPASAAASADCAVSVTAGPLTLKRCDYSLAKQEDRVMVLVDAFPYRERLKTAGPDAMERMAQALAAGPALEKFPKAKSIKVAVAEVPERDVYGLPRWSMLRMLRKFSYKVGPKGALTLETPAP